MKKSFGLFDEGTLSIFDRFFTFKSKKSEITIEKDRIKEAGVQIKSPGVYEFIVIILANIILIAGFLGFKQRSILLLLALLGCANALLYVPLFREKWIKIEYLEAGENKVAYFKSSWPLEIFNNIIMGGKEEEKTLEKITKINEGNAPNENKPVKDLEPEQPEQENQNDKQPGN